MMEDTEAVWCWLLALWLFVKRRAKADRHREKTVCLLTLLTGQSLEGSWLASRYGMALARPEPRPRRRRKLVDPYRAVPYRYCYGKDPFASQLCGS